MQEKVQGFVVTLMKYNDRHNILHLYTREQGMVSLLVPIRKGRRQGVHHALFQPFIEVSAEIESSPRRSFAQLREVALLSPWHRVYASPVRSSLLFFLAEVMERSVRETGADVLLYEFVMGAIAFLEQTDERVTLFHHLFLYQLTEHLGFPPNLEHYHPTALFDMKEGRFVATAPPHRSVLEPREAQTIKTLRKMRWETMHLYDFTLAQRRVMLEYIVEYYQLHIPAFGTLRSLAVLQELSAP